MAGSLRRLGSNVESLGGLVPIALQSVRGARILLAEDNAMNQQVASELFRVLLGWVAPRMVDPQQVGHAAVDAQQLKALCLELEELLSNDDGNAERPLARHAAQLRSVFPTHFLTLQSAMNAFDCE